MDWPNVFRELITFAGWFLTYGAAAFGAVVLRGDGGETPARRAATLGVVGVLVALLAQAIGVAAAAAEDGVSFGAAARAGGVSLAWRLACLAAALAGFLLARAGRRAGFALALGASAGIAFRNVVTGDPRRLLHPVHVFAGGLWIGTLLALVVASLTPAVRRASPAAVAAMVRRFSPLALSSVALLALTGVGSAVRDMTRLADLWTTPWGWTLVGKLVVVAGVVATGFHNWRTATPRLGTDPGTSAFTRTARRELALAAVVLLVSGVLVSLPAPAQP